MENNTDKITTKLIEVHKASDFLYKKLGNHNLKFENYAYNWMEYLNSEYNGGLWYFYELSNGGFYMALSEEDSYLLSSPNGSEIVLPSDSAGIVVSLFALNSLVSNLFKRSINPLYEDKEPDDTEHVSDLYHLLRRFASEHKDKELIYKLID